MCMLGITERLFGLGTETLVDHYSLTVEKQGDQIVFKPSHYYDRNASLVMDNERYEINSEMTFSVDYLQSENAVVTCVNDLLHSFSTDKLDETVGIVFSKDQISSIKDITVNNDRSVFDSEYEFDVFIADSIVIITVSEFYTNNTAQLDVLMEGAYPSVRIKSMEVDDQLFDLSTLERRKFSVESEIGFEGDIRFGSNKLSITTGCEYNIGRGEKIYCGADDVVGRIQRWNDTDIEVEVRPDSYCPITVSPDRVVDGTVIVELERDDIVPLSNLTVSYPEWVVGIDPRLKYEDADPSSKYSQRDKIGRNKYVFENVIPFENLRLYHGGGFMRFENNFRDLKPLSEKDGSDINIDLTARQKGLIINSKRSDIVNLIIDDESQQIQPEGSTMVKVDMEDTKVTAKSTDNEMIDQVDLSETVLSEIREVTIANDSIIIS